MKFVAHNVAETGLTIKFVEQINAEDRFTAHNVSKRRHPGLLIVKFFVHHVCRRSKYDTISFAQFRRKYIGTSPIQGTPLFRGHHHSGHTKFGPEKTLTCYLY